MNACSTQRIVLVVDDHPLIRDLLVRELRTGYVVVTAEDHAAAIPLLEIPTLWGVVSDLELGRGCDGLGLLEHVRIRRPSCARILVSGTTDLSRVFASCERGVVQGFVAKPWRRGMVLEALTAALGVRACHPPPPR